MTLIEEKQSKRELYPRVADFYDGKSLLITGAAGFVGMILLEILLRTCPGINSIFILLREKKGVKPEQRKKELLQKVIYNQLSEEQLGKVRLVSGDISKPDLGMSESDLEEVVQNVSIVFHCAADLNFVKPLKYIMGTNALGTHYVVEVCKKLKKVEALVFTSTICSNCNRKDTIEEEIYRLAFPSERYFKEYREGTEESLQALVSQCRPLWPNGYTFNKCLAENILLENAAQVPSAVIRPSLVALTWKAPSPGFFGRNSSLALLSEGCGKGFIKVMLLDEDNPLDYIPVDVVANCHIVAAWKIASERSKVPFVVNLSAYGQVHETWRDYKYKLLQIKDDYPLPNCFRTPTTVLMTSSKLVFYLMSIYEHYVPAYVFDLFLKLSGSKLRMVRLYKLFDKAMETGSFFTINRYKYDTTNFRTMEDDLTEEDKETFYTNIKDADIGAMVDLIPINDLFDWKNDKLPKKERIKKANMRLLYSNVIKYVFLIIMSYILYNITSALFQLF